MTDEPVDIESRIRKDSYRNRFFRLLEKDVNTYVMPFENDFVRVRCPNCASTQTAIEFRKQRFDFERCAACQTLFVNPRPTPALLSSFYENSEAIAASTQSLIENEKGRKQYIFIPRAELIRSVLEQYGFVKGRLLEIGCSIGSFLRIFSDITEFSVEGVDPSDPACTVCRKRRLTVHQTTLETLASSEHQHDVVLSFETIEHTFDPAVFMQKVYTLIKPGGIFVFTTPNCHGFDMMALEQYYKNIHAPSHLNYFNIDTIDILMKASGFRVIEEITPGILDVNIVRKQIEEGVFPPNLSPVVRHLVSGVSSEVQHKFQEFLREHRLSGNMLVFAQKL